MYNFHLSLAALRCNISSGGEKNYPISSFEFVLRVFFAEDFGIRIDEILLKRKFFNMLFQFFFFSVYLFAIIKYNTNYNNNNTLGRQSRK